MLGTLHHLHQPKQALVGIVGLLKPGGLIGLHEVTYRRSHHSHESSHNDHVPLDTILSTLEESCDLIDVKQEGALLRQLVAAKMAESMRTRPRLTKAVQALDTIGEPLGRLHRVLGPRAVLVTARKR
jgi:hypothetical protein